jgi:hypothetical protein
VNPISPRTVALCAVSKNRLLREMMTSSLLDCARLAASCAARSRATRCSGVSVPASTGPRLLPGGGDAACLDPAGAAAAAPVRANRPAVCDVLEEEFRGAAVLDSACGVVEVKRVASETDLGPVVPIAIVRRGCVRLVPCSVRSFQSSRWVLSPFATGEPLHKKEGMQC